MNLGTLIGELRLKLANAEELVPVAPKPKVWPKPTEPKPERIGTAASIRRVLAGHPVGLTAPMIAELTGIEVRLVSATLHMMRDIDKAGQRGEYVFSLAGAPA